MENLLDIEKKTLCLRREFGQWLLRTAISASVRGSLISFELPRGSKSMLAYYSSIKFTYYVSSESIVVTMPTTVFLYHLPWSYLRYISFM